MNVEKNLKKNIENNIKVFIEELKSSLLFTKNALLFYIIISFFIPLLIYPNFNFDFFFYFRLFIYIISEVVILVLLKIVNKGYIIKKLLYLEVLIIVFLLIINIIDMLNNLEMTIDYINKTLYGSSGRYGKYGFTLVNELWRRIIEIIYGYPDNYIYPYTYTIEYRIIFSIFYFIFILYVIFPSNKLIKRINAN